MKRNLTALRLALLFAAAWLLGPMPAAAQTYRPVDGFPEETNRQIESFLNSTLPVKAVSYTHLRAHETSV